MRRQNSGGRLPRLVAGVAVLLLTFTSSLPAGTAAAKEPPLRYAGGAYGTLDPAFITDAGDVQLLLQLYAGLTRLDEEGNPYASLAESWSVSSDGRTYTFRMRPGLKFSDGSPLDATDVRRSWLRILDPATRSTAPDVLTLIDGASERLAGGPESGVAIDASDPRTLVVGLRHPAGYFPSIAATPTAFVVPSSASSAPDWQRPGSFIGSGPYLAAAVDGEDLVLRGNPRYVAGPPPIDEVRWVAHLREGAAAGYASEVVDLAPIGSADAGWVSFDATLGPAIHEAASLQVQYFGFDTTRAPFDDARVRRAFALALDRTRLVSLAEGSTAIPATSVVPPALWPGGMTDDSPTDLAAARRLLDDAGYHDRGKLGKITVNGTGLDVGPAVAIWERDLGVTIVVEEMKFADYLQALEANPPQVFTINWVADYPSPYALYSLLLLPQATSNYGHWEDPEFVRLLEVASAAVGESGQALAYRAVDGRVDQEAPVIPWAYATGWLLVRPGLRGLGNLTIGLMDFGRVSWDG